MTEFLADPFWRGVAYCFVIILAAEFALHVLVVLVTVPGRRKREAIARASQATQIADRIWDRLRLTQGLVGTELDRRGAEFKEWHLYDENHPANAVRNDIEMGARMSTPDATMTISRPYDPERDPMIEAMYRGTMPEEPLGPVQGPQEPPESEGPDEETEDDAEAHTGPLSPVVEEIPTFGRPTQRLYRAADYEWPLRCSVPSGACGGRELTEGELFYEIPNGSDPDGPFFVLCTEDVGTLDAVHEYAPGTMVEPDLGARS